MPSLYEVILFCLACCLVCTAGVRVDVSGPVLADTGHLVVVVKAFAEVASLTDVDGPPLARLGFSGEDVVAGGFLLLRSTTGYTQ